MIAGSAWLLPALPAAAAVLLLLFGRRLRSAAAWLAVLMTAVPTALASWMLVQEHDQLGRVTERSHTIASLGPLSVHASTTVDGLAALLCVVVTVVALLVQVYSTAYMREDSRYPSYAAFVSLFTAAMLVVVLSGDLLWLLVGWEVMGICSYLLIGHHWEDKPNTDAAISAFLVTRFGDLGFTAGLATLAVSAKSTSIPVVLQAHYSHITLVVASLLVLMGVIGKSAQFPLQTWLPDAMAGPTPVSALIHAATMVAAGVYVIARLSPVVLSTAAAANFLAVIAAITMLFAALCAFAQDDLKRVLAWSTVSQLAYMYAGLAMGNTGAGIAHLVTHAAFKALLFLAAGCVAHAVGSTLLSAMGGLRNGSRVVLVSMTIGLAALAGVPFLSGFVSKDAVLESAWHAAHDGADVAVLSWAGWVVLISGLLTAIVTAAYCTRTWIKVFGGPARRAASHPVPVAMTAPIALLSIPAAGLGFVLLHSWLTPMLAPLKGDYGFFAYAPLDGSVAVHTLIHQGGFEIKGEWLLISAAAVLIGFLVSYLASRGETLRDPARVLGPLRPWFRDGMRMGELYVRVFVRPIRERLAPAVGTADRLLVDGSVVGVGRSASGLGGLLRRSQTGNVQLYITVALVGILALAVGAVAL